MIADLLTKVRLVRFSAAVIVAAVMVAVCTPSPARAEVIDRVLAVVGGQLITLTDVAAARDLRLVAPAAVGDPTRNLLTKLIDRELVLAEGERYAPPEPTTDAVDVEGRRVRARLQSDAAFAAALGRS